MKINIILDLKKGQWKANSLRFTKFNAILNNYNKNPVRMSKIICYFA